LRAQIESAVCDITQAKGQLNDLGSSVTEELERQVGVRGHPADIGEWLPLSSQQFVARLVKVGKKGLSSGAVERVAQIQSEARTRQVGLLTRQLDLERRLATLVEDAYGLTPEERSLLRSTRPVRDPLDVLEARIRGKGSQAPADNDEE
jgi:hypothetical protein